MTDPAGAEQFHAVTDMISAGEESAVRHCQQPRFGRDAEGRFELRRVSQPLVVGQPESHDAVIGVLPSQPRQLLGVISRAPPTRRHHHPGRDARLRRGSQHGLHRRARTTEHRGVAGRVQLDLQPPAPVRGVDSGGLGDHPHDVRTRADHRPRSVVPCLEVRPATPHTSRERRWDRHPVTARQIQQRRRAHRPSQVQMQMQMGFRQRSQTTHPALSHSSTTMPAGGGRQLAKPTRVLMLVCVNGGTPGRVARTVDEGGTSRIARRAPLIPSTGRIDVRAGARVLKGGRLPRRTGRARTSPSGHPNIRRRAK